MKYFVVLWLLELVLLKTSEGQNSPTVRESMQIVYSDPLKENSYVFNKKSLERLLLEDENVRDRLIVSVSIAGAMRTGKSFILGFFLRYLNAQYKKHDITNWLENSEDTKGSSFKWKNGIDVRHTQGIHLWSEIFLHNADDGKKYAILIFDTQGIFDQFSTMKDNNVIFATTAFISTVQIFNVMRNINEDDYQHLQQFAAFGAAAVADSDFKPFQKLLFLIRDSPPVDGHMQFEGGKRLLEARAKSNKEGNSTRDKVNAAFDSVECFLMSAPGYEVSEEPDFNGSLSVIRSKFKDQLNTLIPHILGPNNLKPKKINGDVVTARSFIDYLNLYIDFFKSSDSPNPQNFMEANANANNAKAVSDGYKMYEENSVNSSQNISKLSEMKERHEDFLQQVLAEFDKKTKYGGKALSAPFRLDLQEKVMTLHTSIRREFERNINENASLVSYKFYEDLTVGIGDGISTLSEFDGKANRFSKLALDVFDDKTKGGELELSAPNREKLQEKIETRCTALRKEFETTINEKASLKSYKLYEVLTVGIGDGISTLKEFDNKANGFSKQALDVFDFQTKGGNFKLTALVRQKLQEKIETRRTTLRREFEGLNNQKASINAYKSYLDLTIKIEDGISTLSEFDYKEYRIRVQTMDAFNAKIQGSDLKFSAPIRSNLEEKIEMRCNTLRKDFERDINHNAAKHAYQKYGQLMTDVQIGLNSLTQFDNKESNYRNQAMQEFYDKTNKGDSKLTTPIKESLYERIATSCSYLRQNFDNELIRRREMEEANKGGWFTKAGRDIKDFFS